MAWIGVGIEKSGFKRTKAQIYPLISESGQDRTRVTTKDQCVVPCELSIDAKINDLGWPWRVIMHSVSKHVRHGVVTYMWFHIQSTFRQWMTNQMFNLVLARPVLYGLGLWEPEGNNNRRAIGCRKNKLHRAVSLQELVYLKLRRVPAAPSCWPQSIRWLASVATGHFSPKCQYRRSSGSNKVPECRSTRPRTAAMQRRTREEARTPIPG